MEGKTPVLQAKSLGIQFGGLKAVDDFNADWYSMYGEGKGICDL